MVMVGIGVGVGAGGGCPLHSTHKAALIGIIEKYSTQLPAQLTTSTNIIMVVGNGDGWYWGWCWWWWWPTPCHSQSSSNRYPRKPFHSKKQHNKVVVVEVVHSTIEPTLKGILTRQ